MYFKWLPQLKVLKKYWSSKIAWKMIYYEGRDHDLDGPECISLSFAGKLIALIEIAFYASGYYVFEDYFKDDLEKLILLGTIFGLMTFFSISLLCGVVKVFQS